MASSFSDLLRKIYLQDTCTDQRLISLTFVVSHSFVSFCPILLFVENKRVKGTRNATDVSSLADARSYLHFRSVYTNTEPVERTPLTGMARQATFYTTSLSILSLLTKYSSYTYVYVIYCQTYIRVCVCVCRSYRKRNTY